MLNLILLSIAIVLVCLLIPFVRRRSKVQNLSGKVALVTGGSNGLGQKICLELAKHGCNIVIADISPANETIRQLEQFNVKSKAYKVDVSNYKEITQLKVDIENEFGDVDVLINNAGLISYKTIFEQTSEELERLVKVNVNSVSLMTKCFLGRMIEKNQGHIVSISSLQGIYAFPYSINYCCTKFAVTGFMLGLKEFLRRKNLWNIRTTLIFPHVISTRDDVINVVSQKLKLLTPQICARTVVKAIIYNRSFVTIPGYYAYIVPIFNVLPFFVQHIIRDYFQREHLFMRESKS